MSLGLPKKINNGADNKPIVFKPIPVLPDYGDYSINVTNLYYSYNRDLRMSLPAKQQLDVDNSMKTDDNTDNNDTDTTTSTTKTPPGWVLWNVTMQLQRGCRCLLIGANGSGKSTLLRILAGRHMASTSNSSIESNIKVLGLNAFHDTKLNFHRAYLDCDWGMRNIAFVGGSVPLAADIPVYKMMEQLQLQYPERRQQLLDLLGININWHMHQLSDGQRRRVQIFLGLLRPFTLLLLDEVTTSLDVCVRQDLLRWLHNESIVNNATIIYATHIFDGLDTWPSHLYYLTNTGTCGWQGTIDQLDTIVIDPTSTITTTTTASTSTDTVPTTTDVDMDIDTISSTDIISNTTNSKKRKSSLSMLAIAERWLRAELEENKRQRIYEKAQYAASISNTTTTDGNTSTSAMNDTEAELYNPKSQGGYGSGRLATIVPLLSNGSASTATATTNANTSTRQGRLSDIMGNSGTLHKVHRSVAK